jgi:hypothetical protein
MSIKIQRTKSQQEKNYIRTLDDAIPYNYIKLFLPKPDIKTILNPGDYPSNFSLELYKSVIRK